MTVTAHYVGDAAPGEPAKIPLSLSLSGMTGLRQFTGT
jgi:hypothetical protein